MYEQLSDLNVCSIAQAELQHAHFPECVSARGLMDRLTRIVLAKGLSLPGSKAMCLQTKLHRGSALLSPFARGSPRRDGCLDESYGGVPNHLPLNI